MPKPKTSSSKKFSRPRRSNAFRRTPRGCRLCKEKIEKVGYKDVDLLNKFITEHGKIIAGRISGNCASHQRKVARAIRKARTVALLPFVTE